MTKVLHNGWLDFFLVLCTQVRFLSSKQSWTVIRKRRRRRLWRKSLPLWQLARTSGEAGEMSQTSTSELCNTSPSIWRQLSHSVSSPLQRFVPRCCELHADGQPGIEEAGLPLPDELCQESARYGYHGSQHLCKGTIVINVLWHSTISLLNSFDFNGIIIKCKGVRLR